MNTRKNNIILISLLIVFFMLFRFSSLVHSSVIDSITLFFTNIVPSMLPMFIMIDLLLNYGLANILFRIFKTNSVILVILSFLSGTPSNAKYIREFYQEGYISKDLGNLLLSFSYSPNPLFILAFFPNITHALMLISYIYITDFILYLFFKRKFKSFASNPKEFKHVPFAECLSNSIYKSFKVLILILGIIVTLGVLNSLLDALNIKSCFLSSILELTNAFNIISRTNGSILWMIFAATFGGLSIHSQIKSILEDTDLSYRYFLLGRVTASIPILIAAILN